jgi:hypothetical protein
MWEAASETGAGKAKGKGKEIVDEKEKGARSK